MNSPPEATSLRNFPQQGKPADGQAPLPTGENFWASTQRTAPIEHPAIRMDQGTSHELAVQIP